MDQLTRDVATDVARLAEEFTQWRIADGTPGALLPQTSIDEHPARRFTLKGSVPRKFLQWEEQTWGINLGWTDDASPATAQRVKRWFVDRSGSADGPIRYGESVALAYGKSPSFLRYANRTVGVNLEWSSGPVFEWKLLGGPADQPLDTRNPVAIYNAKAGWNGSPGNFLIHFDRTVGGDIGWPDSKNWGDHLKALGIKLATEAVKKYVLTELGLRT